MHHVRKNLSEKGWAAHEIEHAMSILSSAEAKKPKILRSIDSSMYHLTFILAIVVHLILSVMFVLLSLVMNSVGLYIFVMIIGISFGALFSHMMESLKHLTQRQHIIAAAYLTALSLVIGGLVVTVSNYISSIIRIGFQEHSPWVFGVVYSLSFILPYIFFDFGELEKAL